MPRRTEHCSACGHAFEIGEPFQACLYATPDGYARQDYCLDCPPPAEPEPIGVWQTRVPEPAPRRVHVFDREAIYGFFTRLEDAAAPEQVQFRFVLALLLWRKKALKLERTVSAPEGEAWEFLTPRTGTLHRVLRPALDEEQLERLSDELERVLAGQPGQLGLVIPDGDEEPDRA